MDRRCTRCGGLLTKEAGKIRCGECCRVAYVGGLIILDPLKTWREFDWCRKNGKIKMEKERDDAIQ